MSKQREALELARSLLADCPSYLISLYERIGHGCLLRDGTMALRQRIESALPDIDAALAAPDPQPVGWLVSPHGKFRANRLMTVTWPPASLKWSIPVYLNSDAAPGAPAQQEWPQGKSDSAASLTLYPAPAREISDEEILKFARTHLCHSQQNSPSFRRHIVCFARAVLAAATKGEGK